VGCTNIIIQTQQSREKMIREIRVSEVTINIRDHQFVAVDSQARQQERAAVTETRLAKIRGAPGFIAG
jgi:hypothetical protein